MAEFGEIRKFEGKLPGRGRSELADKIRSLEVGLGFDVKGIERASLSTTISSIAKATKRKFGTTKVGAHDGAITVFRKE